MNQLVSTLQKPLPDGVEARETSHLPHDAEDLDSCVEWADAPPDDLVATDFSIADTISRKRQGWPTRDMPRERLFDAGTAALSDTEMVALVLGSGMAGHDVFGIARSLLQRFGSLRAMLDATPEDFAGLRGVGPAKRAQLLAIIEMARRALAEKMRERPLIDSPDSVEDYLRLLIGARPYEVFVCLFLDARHRLIRTEENSRGSLTRMAVYPREIVRRTLAANAASLIVAHNHPSGAVKPSASDRQLTQVLRDTLALIDVQLIDHLVIGAHDTYSFARADWS
ncbi:DNA repair protein RadC [Paraburkholderia sp.]|uniref:RadC family protein n=1 Tax=Paraburkholderia sp. TaxID=1926495 RepID=UPI0023981980|nr:DNA repair protein RadC [Paraburkholderia sp.]MDE1183062.1 DNA repair protein RadC [Paraburkholderia sp.]